MGGRTITSVGATRRDSYRPEAGERHIPDGHSVSMFEGPPTVLPHDA